MRTKKWWLHIVADELHTYLFASHTRARSAPEEAGVLGDFSGVMVHDRLAMHFTARQGDPCDLPCAYAPRPRVGRGTLELGLGEQDGHALCEMNDATHAARDAGKKRLSKTKLDGFFARYDALVAVGLSANPAPEHHRRNYLERDSYNIACALRDLRTEATRFAVDLSVPMTNNEAERSLRMAKIHGKVRGCFQSEDGARYFAAIRFCIATARKQDVGALEVLGRLFRGDAWMRPATT